MEPCFARARVVPCLDRFVDHVSISAAETSDFLVKALSRVFHQFALTPIP